MDEVDVRPARERFQLRMSRITSWCSCTPFIALASLTAATGCMAPTGEGVGVADLDTMASTDPMSIDLTLGTSWNFNHAR